MADDIKQLKEKLKSRIDFLRGDFTLASGKKSDFYFNGKTTTLRPDALNYAARIFIDMMRQAKPDRVCPFPSPRRHCQALRPGANVSARAWLGESTIRRKRSGSF